MTLTVPAKVQITASDKEEIAQKVWQYSTRKLTNLDDARAAKIDNLDATISSRVSTTHFDEVIGDPTTPTVDMTIAGYLKGLQLVVVAEDDIVMDGTEKTLIEVKQADLESYEVPFIIEGYVDLSPMQAGDTIVIREYASLEEPLSYKKYAEHTYSDAQDEPLVRFTKKIGSKGYKVTAQQTAGTYRTLPIYFERRRNQ